MTQTPETPFDKLDRLEVALGKFAEITTQNAVRYDRAIESLTTNVNQLTQNLNNLAEQTNRNINNLITEAAHDRQQAAIDRQEIRRIWEYLRDQNGGSSPRQR